MSDYHIRPDEMHLDDGDVDSHAGVVRWVRVKHWPAVTAIQ